MKQLFSVYEWFRSIYTFNQYSTRSKNRQRISVYCADDKRDGNMFYSIFTVTTDLVQFKQRDTNVTIGNLLAVWLTTLLREDKSLKIVKFCEAIKYINTIAVESCHWIVTLRQIYNKIKFENHGMYVRSSQNAKKITNIGQRHHRICVQSSEIQRKLLVHLFDSNIFQTALV